MKRDTQTPPEMPRVSRTVDAIASDWIVRKREGLDPRAEKQLAAWLADDIAHAEAFERMGRMANLLQRVRTTQSGESIVTQLWVCERTKQRRRRTLTAALALMAIVALGVWFRPGSLRIAENSIASTWEPIRRLPDGSIVELNKGAEIAVSYSPAIRKIELLRGEALFRVEKDSARPFVVHARGVDVRAVGTAFNVRLRDTGVEVLVTEGKVGVDDPVRAQSLVPPRPKGSPSVLEAGQKLTVAVGARSGGESPPTVALAEVSAAEIKQELAWRIPRFDFDGVELARAAAQMNAVNRLRIVVEGEATSRLRITGNFAPDDSQGFARLVAASLGLEIEPRGESELVLRRPVTK